MTAPRHLPAAEYVRNLLDYDPVTGCLIWKPRPCKPWSSGFAGKVAGSPSMQGHIKVRVDGVTYLAHRLIWLIICGVEPSNQIDHKNGDPADNRWLNLREATSQDNNRNRRIGRNNSSGFKGVCYSWRHRNFPWKASIGIDGKQEHLGYFATAELAHAAYCAAAAIKYGKFARAA